MSEASDNFNILLMHVCLLYSLLDVDVPALSYSGLLNVNKGSILNLTCHASSSNPQFVQYQWYKNSVQLFGQRSEVLRIDVNSTQDEGSYSCGVQMFNLQKLSDYQLELKMIGKD